MCFIIIRTTQPLAQQVYAVASLDVTEKSELRAESEQTHLERLCKEPARQLSALSSHSFISKVFKSAVNISERNPASLIFITNYSHKTGHRTSMWNRQRDESEACRLRSF